MRISTWMIAVAALAIGVPLAGCTPPGASADASLMPLPMHELVTASAAPPAGAAIQPIPVRPSPLMRPMIGYVPADWVVKGSRPWRYIVIHHSGAEKGNATIFDRSHKQRGWDELGYHFVIDNGNGETDGLVEVGPRWAKQKWGAHCKTPDNEYNDYGIGICMVGDFNNHMPTPAQLTQLKRLVQYLMRTYNIPPDKVIGHREAPGAHTDCPGDAFYNYLRTTLRPALARGM